MQLFIYTYTDNATENFKVTKDYGVFGGKKNWRLRRGDLIIIRDGSKNDQLTLFGCCKVTGQGFDQSTRHSPYRDFLFTDEEKSKKIIYPFRIAVDFETAPKLSRLRIVWTELDNLSKHLIGKRDWMMRFRSGYVWEPNEIEVFSKLFFER